ncbi:MAG: VWA domain-containing protein [Desulfatibacillaceae bacterium]
MPMPLRAVATIGACLAALFIAAYCSATAAPAADIPPTDIMLVLDNSGSMKTNDPGFLTRSVVTNFTRELGPTARLGMVVFDKKARLEHPLERMDDQQTRQAFLAALDQVDYSGQRTNSPAGVERAVYELKASGRPEAGRVIIFLTDGIVDTGDAEKDEESARWLRGNLAAEARESGIRIFAVAFTDNADYRTIQSLANVTNGEYYRAYTAGDIPLVFDRITAELARPAAGEIPPAPRSDGRPPAGEPAMDRSPPRNDAELSLAWLTADTLLLLVVVISAIFVVSRLRRRAFTRGRDSGAGGVPPMRARLVPEGGPGQPQGPIELNKPVMFVGRDENCHIRINRKTVSSRHAVILFKDAAFFLEDRNSTNGTFLEGVKISPNKAYRLKNGDDLSFDVYRFSFVLPGPPSGGQTVLSSRDMETTMIQADAQNPRSPRPMNGDETARHRIQRQPPRKPRTPEHGPSGEGDAQSGEKAAKSVDKMNSTAESRASETMIKSRMCPNHPSWRATEFCELCRKGFCRQCVVAVSGRTLCAGCARQLGKK